MKRTGQWGRKKPLRSKSKLKSINKARQAKKRAKYRSYMQSRVWKEKRAACIKRAEKQCEYKTGTGCDEFRCPNTTYLQAHHKTYRRFGGKERPEDLQCLCKWHHKLVEDALRPWNRNRRSA